MTTHTDKCISAANRDEAQSEPNISADAASLKAFQLQYYRDRERDRDCDKHSEAEAEYCLSSDIVTAA